MMILLLRLLGAGLLLGGLVLAAGDIRLGAPLSEFFGHLLLLPVGALLLLRRVEVVALYALISLIAGLWVLLEVELDVWQLLPHLTLWLTVGALFLPAHRAFARLMDRRRVPTLHG